MGGRWPGVVLEMVTAEIRGDRGAPAGWFEIRGSVSPRSSCGAARVIQDGRIYVVDVRNGRDVLRYHGPRAAQVAAARFAEGTSDL